MTPDSGAVRGHLGNHPRQRVAVGGVARDHPHPGTGGLQLGDEFAGPRRVRAAAAEQHQILNTMVGHQVTSQRRTRHARAAGNQHGAGASRPARRQCHDDLADVAGLAQVPQRRTPRRTSNVVTGNGFSTPASNSPASSSIH